MSIRLSVFSFTDNNLLSVHNTIMAGFYRFTFISKLFESVRYKTYNKTCSTSEDSGPPAHPCSLIRVFADRMYLLQLPGYSKRNKRVPLSYLVAVQADLSLCWSHRSYCRICRVLAHLTSRVLMPCGGRKTLLALHHSTVYIICTFVITEPI